MYKIEAYHCSYCRKYSTSKSLIKKHDAICFKNPASKSCVTCDNFVDVQSSVEDFYTKECHRNVKFTDRGNKTIFETNCPLWKLSLQLEEEYGEEIL